MGKQIPFGESIGGPAGIVPGVELRRAGTELRLDMAASQGCDRPILLDNTPGSILATGRPPVVEQVVRPGRIVGGRAGDVLCAAAEPEPLCVGVPLLPDCGDGFGVLGFLGSPRYLPVCVE